jgi:hypothetical protein
MINPHEGRARYIVRAGTAWHQFRRIQRQMPLNGSGDNRRVAHGVRDRGLPARIRTVGEHLDTQREWRPSSLAGPFNMRAMPHAAEALPDPVCVIPRRPFQPLVALRFFLEAAWMSRMIGNTLAANCAAYALRATRMRSTAPVASGVPSRFPRALAAARAALVRPEIASRSCSTRGH